LQWKKNFDVPIRKVFSPNAFRGQGEKKKKKKKKKAVLHSGGERGAR